MVTASFCGTSGKVLLNDKEFTKLKYIDLKVIPVYKNVIVGCTTDKKAI